MILRALVWAIFACNLLSGTTNAEPVLINVFTAIDFVAGVRRFAETGVDTTLHLHNNISLFGLNTTQWPVGALKRGTLKIQPSPANLQSGQKVFLDAGM